MNFDQLMALCGVIVGFLAVLATIIMPCAFAIAKAIGNQSKATNETRLAVANVHTKLEQNRNDLKTEMNQGLERVHNRIDEHKKQSADQFHALKSELHDRIQSIDGRLVVVERELSQK